MNPTLQKIDHIVVLMLENRSFDNMLGWLGAYEGKQTVNGVAGKNLTNPIPQNVERPEGVSSVPVGKDSRVTNRLMTNPNPDPGEEYQHVNTQLYGQVIPDANRFYPFDVNPYNLPTQVPETAPMNGFVTDYIYNFNHIRKHMPTYDEYKVIMSCFDEESVPVISTLAKEFAVCDAWFAPVPSQTLCNRSFVHAATSHGYVLNSPFYHWLLHDSPTIFNRISDKSDPDISWKIYYDRLDIVSLTGLQNPKLWKYHTDNFRYMEDFESDARNSTLSSYSFIEPRFFIDHNDQHPPVAPQILETSSVLAGELLIDHVYRTLRASPQWNEILLIITFDEHGGCYDHVPPPATVPPDPTAPIGQMGFRFDRLGVRVPTVLVSPYIQRGTVISDVHDHTSILKLVENRWGLDPLTERDKHANDLSNVLNLKSPREQRDLPDTHPHPYVPPENMREEPINELQKGLLMIMAGFEEARQIHSDTNYFEKAKELCQLVLDEERIAHIKTVGQAIDFTMEFDQGFSFWRWLKWKIRGIFQTRKSRPVTTQTGNRL